MDYCLDGGDGTASIWTGDPNFDLDDDGVLDAVRLDLDGDGVFDDAIIDDDGDGTGDFAALDLDDDGIPEARFTDDGSGGWAIGGGWTDRGLRWFDVGGAEHTGAVADVDGDGLADRIYDVDRDGRADRVFLNPGDALARTGYADTDGDGRWDVRLTDIDGDGTADSAGVM